MYTDKIKNINDEKIRKQTLDDFETQENMLHMIFEYHTEGKIQGNPKRTRWNWTTKNVNGRRRKKTREEKEINLNVYIKHIKS